METKSLSLSIILIVMMPHSLWSQMVIQSDTKFTASAATLSVNCNVINNSMATDFSGVLLRTTGQDQLLRTSTSMVLDQFDVSGGGVKTLEGEWEISNVIDFNDGIIFPSNAGISGKMKFSGTTQPEGSNLSFVKGMFYSEGGGQRNFPIGNDAGYFPAVLTNVVEPGLEFGIEVIETNPMLALPSEELEQGPRYWSVTSTTGASSSTSIGLSVTQSTFPNLRNSLVVAGDTPGGIAVDLGRENITNNFIFSQMSILPNNAIYTYAVGPEIKLIIHNMITPTAEGIDGKLHIDNIELFPNNIVMLVDRWGGKIHSWTSFTNEDESFDFNKLSPGNYVCIVEFTDSFGKSVSSQVITILK